jgi:hypothetical protein
MQPKNSTREILKLNLSKKINIESLINKTAQNQNQEIDKNKDKK